MLPVEQEKICRVIDQRNRDQAVISFLTRLQEPPIVYWTGIMTVNNRFLTVLSDGYRG